MVPPLIALEEHFFSEAMLTGPTDKYSEQFKHTAGILQRLTDVGDIRLKHMDAGEIVLQVVSHAPGHMSYAQCVSANNQLVEAVKAHPDRFAGFAVLPVSEPENCAGEFTRCVQELGFVGALIDNHARDGGYFDGEEYFEMFKTAQDLDVPIYLHPTFPTDAMASMLYTGNFSNGASISMGGSGWGWHSDVAIHILRLFAAGLFERLPRLKIIIGHMGEMIPFMLARIEMLSPRWGVPGRTFTEVYQSNIYLTTSGYWSVDPLACILRNTKIDHILYSVDYPFGTNEDGLVFFKALEKSGLVTQEQLEMIAYKNAEKLLRVKARTT